MGRMKRIKQTIKYKVPSWEYCNHITNSGDKSTSKCRFCVGSDKNGYICVLHNMPLMFEGIGIVRKVDCCSKHSIFNPMVIEEVEDQALSDNEPMVDPKKVMKMTIDEFIKVKKKLENQGFPSAMAEKLAKEFMLKG